MISLKTIETTKASTPGSDNMIPKRTSITVLIAGLVAMLGLTALFAGQASGAITYDPEQCTAQVTYDPGIPTPESVYGGTLAPNTGGTNALNSAAKKNTDILYPYLDELVEAAPEIVQKRDAGETQLGRDIPFVIISSPANMADVDEDAAFWRGVRSGDIPAQVARAQINSRPVFSWISSNVHGDESSSAEATIKLIYELAARRDCANYDRLEKMTSFLLPVQNPDGRDNYQRTNAWQFDLNRDWATQEHIESFDKMSAALEYPSVVYVDAHQQSGSSFFFPPNEDPVHHEISDAAMDAINFIYGPALQKRFNDQNISYNNYSSYDLFTPEYGDTVPSLLLGAAGMTYEKGRGGSYAKQVYDHYLSLDETLNTTVRLKRKLLTAWIDQWEEAAEQGANGELEPNQIVSPSHTISWEIPDEKVYGYFFKPNNHDGDTADLISLFLRFGVKVYRLDEAVTVTGHHVFGDMDVIDPNLAGPERQRPRTSTETLPAGTLYIPMAQTMKHWIQAMLGEDPYVPYAYFYDVAGYSFSLIKGMSGNGYLMDPLPLSASLTRIAAPDLGGAPATPANYYAFNTDSSKGLIMLFKLADEGVTAYRTASGFVAGGREFLTGTAIVDGDDIENLDIDLESYSDTYQTPVTGLAELPDVGRYEIADPKIAILTGGTGSDAVPPDNYCTVGTTFCQAYYTIRDKMGVPLEAITTTELIAGDLISGNFTAVINPATSISGAGATALQNFVNGGGTYFGWGAGGITSARNAGMTNVNTTTNGPTGGVPVKVDFNTDSPLSWGFDNGGFLYRASGAVTINPTTLAGNGTTIPDAVESIRYPNPTLRFAYGTSIANLNGRTAAADQGFGAGRVTILSIDPTFRAWAEGSERLILNGILYPKDAVISPNELRQPVRFPSGSLAPGEGKKLTGQELPAVKNRPAKTFHDPTRDIRVKVRKKDARKLRKVFRNTAPARVKKRAKFVRKGRTVTLVVRNEASLDGHNKAWVSRLQNRLGKRNISPVWANW